MRLLIVGEAPPNPATNSGPRESWPLWRTLDRWLVQAGWEEGEALRTPFVNVYPHFPGHDEEGAPRRITGKMLREAAHLVDAAIREARPDVVLALGRTALNQLAPGTGHVFERDGGKAYSAERAGHEFVVVPMPHPSGRCRVWNEQAGRDSGDRGLEKLARFRRRYEDARLDVRAAAAPAAGPGEADAPGGDRALVDGRGGRGVVRDEVPAGGDAGVRGQPGDGDLGQGPVRPDAPDVAGEPGPGGDHVDAGWRLPGRVVVGPHVFRVVLRDGPFVGGQSYDTLQGEIDHLAGEIRLADAYPERLYCTLWHEVLHACDDLAGTSLEEAQVDRLANVVAMVLMQNPALRGGGLQIDPDAV